jgi:hypothetical protein
VSDGLSERRNLKGWTMFSKRTQLSQSQVIDSDRLQQHSLSHPDSSIFERDSHYFNLFTVPALPKQVIPSVYSFPQFHPTPFRRLPGIWKVKSNYRKTRLGQSGWCRLQGSFRPLPLSRMQPTAMKLSGAEHGSHTCPPQPFKVRPKYQLCY